MPDVDQYIPGTPSWVDVTAKDVDASVAFYGGLFGWEASATGTEDETGGYRMFSMRGRTVAGVGPWGEGGPPAMWTTDGTVQGADATWVRATCATATQAGGTVFLPPMDVLEAGRMAVIADPQGAVFAIWQPNRHPGAQIVNEPGSLVWNELAARDIAPEPAFYAAVFGWEADTEPMAGTPYTTWKRGEKPVGGMVQMTDEWPAGMLRGRGPGRRGGARRRARRAGPRPAAGRRGRRPVRSHVRSTGRTVRGDRDERSAAHAVAVRSPAPAAPRGRPRRRPRRVCAAPPRRVRRRRTPPRRGRRARR